jgi:hypothetical protein
MSKARVADFLKNSYIYAYESDDLFEVINCMKKFNIDKISVVDENLALIRQLKKQSIKTYLRTNFFLFGNIIHALKNIKVKDIIVDYSMPLVFYPETCAEHAFSVMKYMNNEYAPVVETPLDKKLIGFIWLQDKFNKYNFV